MSIFDTLEVLLWLCFIFFTLPLIFEGLAALWQDFWRKK